MIETAVMTWLLDCDPSIRWQVLRDLGGVEADIAANERHKVASEGWGARLLALQEITGRWGGQLYNNKWLSTTYTMLLLRHMGLEERHPQALLACKALLDGGFRQNGAILYAKTVDAVDNGVTGMILSLLAYFLFEDGRVHEAAKYLLDQQEPEGHWEPYPGNSQDRYTFDTTLLVLEGLLEYGKRSSLWSEAVGAAQRKGREFLLRHALFRESLDGKPIDPRMTLFSFPPRWHYDVLTALDYFQASGAPRDVRLTDAMDLLRSRRSPDGRWLLQNRHSGKTFFEMESVGQPSRWNTLRGLRVLKWWERGG